MKISTKGRYALRLMLELAQHDPQENVSIKSIAGRQEISEKYLEQIITMLSRADYVRSARGAQGGYRLAMTPEKYTVGMILRLTEGSLAPVACLDDEPNTCDRSAQCATLVVWERLYEAIKNVLDNVTLADLLEIQRTNSAPDYCI